MKSSLGNLTPNSLDQLAATIRGRLRRIQHQPGLITGLLGQTGSPWNASRRSGQTSIFQPL
jgi:hypothetical protein